MNERGMEAIIMDNHYELYRAVARLCGGHHGVSPAYEWTIAPGENAYPNFIFNERPAAIDAAALRRQVEAGALPSVWISADGGLEPFIGQAGFRLVRIWMGMAMEPGELIRPPEPEGLEWVRVEGPDALEEWTEVVAGAFNTPIEPGFFLPLLGEERMECFMGRREGACVATTLNFYQEDIAGIYMVATKTAFRKQGIGQWAFYRSLRAAFDRGARLAVCSAMPDGISAWQKIGFKIYTKLYLYWLVGKEFI